MKHETISLGARAVTLCSASAACSPGITIVGRDVCTGRGDGICGILFEPRLSGIPGRGGAGERAVPDHDSSATVANSYRSLRGKVLNFAHIMRSYDPERNMRDRIFGTVMAVELSGPDGH